MRTSVSSVSKTSWPFSIQTFSKMSQGSFSSPSAQQSSCKILRRCDAKICEPTHLLGFGWTLVSALSTAVVTEVPLTALYVLPLQTVLVLLGR